MRKVGLCLAFTGENYGMLLQAYATQYVVETMGYETEIINYISGKKKNIKFYPGLLVFGWQILCNKVKNRRKKIADNIDSRYAENEQSRKRRADEFRNGYLHHIIDVHGIDELNEIGKQYHAVIVGSDQQWLPNVAFSNFRTLRFVPDSVIKISYATSFGVEKYPYYCRQAARDFLKRIDYLSVREKQGEKIIESICKEKAKVVLDPTYLISCEEWETLIPSKRYIQDKYILGYFLGNNEESKQRAKEFASKKNLKLVSILSNESRSTIDFKYADEIVSDASPEKFINLIRGAEYVLTDSFHGVAFSIINKTQFFVFYRDISENKNSRNSRIDNILSTWKLEDRLATGMDLSYLLKTANIDYSLIDKTLTKKRDISIKFLTQALKGEMIEE